MVFTLEQIIRQATQELAAVSSCARLEAEVLAMHVCKLSRTELITQGTYEPDSKQTQGLRDLVSRRLRGEPVAYITGHREFWSLDLRVTPDVLIPRPETELLVEQALMHIPNHANWFIADLGTGSGAIALAIAKERPGCKVIATDISESALAIAQENAKRLRIDNIEFRHGPWLQPFAGKILNMIISNPPYIAESDPHLTQGDVCFEPRTSLVAGSDGLDAIRAIACDARSHVKPDGRLLLEHGSDQGPAVARILRQQEYHDISCHTDLAGLNRVTACVLT